MPIRWRVPVVVVIGVLMAVSLVAPHIGVAGQGLGRSLIPTGLLFSQIQASAVGPYDVVLLGLGINVAYLGIGLQQLALVAAFASFWVLATEDINRWIYRVAVVSGWVLALSAPIVLTGWSLIRASGAPALLGWAWLPALVAGLMIIVVGRRSRDRIDRSWYVTKPELQ
ncbi:MAG TPA: hypothetical protein VIT65_07655 [Microlunatus sp.]